MEIKKVAIEKLKPAPYNPRISVKENPKFYEKLLKSIKNFGYVEPIVWNKRTGHIVGGNQRYEILKELGQTEIEVVVVDLSLKDEKALNIALNKIQGDWDFLKLENVLTELKNMNYELDLSGFNQREIEKLLNDLEIKEKVKKEKNIQIPNEIRDWKILNLYAGIGGNRKLWGDLNITAVEINSEIAKVYQKLFPNDKVIVDDAHKYLEEHFDEYDFIWSSPPCPTHSRVRKNFSKSEWRNIKPKYPDLKLYEEILFLQGYYDGLWIVENVISWYEPLIKPQQRGRHYYWSNFPIPEKNYPEIITIGDIFELSTNDSILKKQFLKFGYDENTFDIIPNKSNYSREKIIRNLIHPLEGKYILDCAINFIKNQND